jgi:AraC-like DNA-binding protein
MPETLRGVDADRLERSCTGRNVIRFGAGAAGIERAEAFLTTCAFEPHRHDTYAIGITLAGVQTFRYRGQRRIGLPGQVHVLHPDETHDGAAATDAGLRYRIVYIDPALIRWALDDRELPFVPEPVHAPTPTTRIVASLLADLDEPISELGRVEIAASIADLLRSLSGRPERRISIDAAAVETVRAYLAADPTAPTPAARLEQIAGTDRFTIARQFRRAFGTSPDRYRTMRRLHFARAQIERGMPLAQAAAEAGFADQSHMTRQFKRTYGFTPARWAQAVSDAGGHAAAQPAVRPPLKLGQGGLELPAHLR